MLLLAVIIAVLGADLRSLLRSRSGYPSPSSIKSINNNTGIAAVAWQDANNVLQSRAYYQTAKNEIYESTWLNTESAWYTPEDSISLAMDGSPLAAAVKGNSVVSTGQDTNTTDLSYCGKVLKNRTINLFFLDDSGQVKELVNINGGHWQPVSLNTQHIFLASSSKLAATWSQNHPRTDDPQSLLFVYQDERNVFQSYNSTNDTWVSYGIPGHPIAASGVSLSTLTMRDYPSQLRLLQTQS